MIAESIATQFDIPGRLVALRPIGAGNVNDTYRVILRTTFSEEQFILQRINQAVFKDPVAVMANMKAVTDHAHRRIESEADQADRIWQLPRVIPAKDGKDYVVDAKGGYWRALSMIASSTNYEKVNEPEHAAEAGRVLGHFQREHAHGNAQMPLKMFLALLVMAALFGRQWLSAQHHPGDTVSAPCLLDLVQAAERRLGCHPRRRTELIQQRIQPGVGIAASI
jgi:hypothetical protein